MKNKKQKSFTSTDWLMLIIILIYLAVLDTDSIGGIDYIIMVTFGLWAVLTAVKVVTMARRKDK